MPFKVTYLFNGGRKGWSESWYVNPPGGDVEAILNNAEKVLLRRREMLADTYSVDAIRISNVEVKGHSFLSRNSTGPGRVPAGGLSRDVQKQALLCRVEDESGLYKRPLLIRGCPDDWFVYRAGRELENEDARQAVERFRTEVRNAAFCIRAIARNKGPGAEPFQKIRSINLNNVVAPPRIAIEVPAHGYVAGDIVRISRAKFIGTPAPAVNGVWEVIIGVVPPAISADWFSINLEFDQRLTDFVRYFHGGLVQKRSIIFPRIAQNGIHIERFTQRDTGSAFFRGRGRSRAVRR